MFILRAEPRHWFRAYGLVFAASVPIPEMMPVERADLTPGVAPDVIIREARFPDDLPDPIATSDVHQVNREALLLRVAGVGRYLVTSGREILIHPEPTATPHDVRVYLLGTCLGALLHQRGLYVLHASGVATGQGAVLFAGASGAGKSTLLAELVSRGYSMVVDDVCAVRVDHNEQPTVVPSYPRTRLWADAAERFAIDTTELPRTRSSWDKFERQVAEFSGAEARLTHVFHLAAPKDDEDCSLDRLGPIDAFTTLVDNTYRSVLLDGMNIRGDHFELASRLARSVEVIRVRRPAESNSLEQLADLVVEAVGDR